MGIGKFRKRYWGQGEWFVFVCVCVCVCVNGGSLWDVRGISSSFQS